MIDLNQVMTFTEAADKWGFANGNTIRKRLKEINSCQRKFVKVEMSG